MIVETGRGDLIDWISGTVGLGSIYTIHRISVCESSTSVVE